MANLLGAVLCRLVLATSTAFSTTNQITVEFNTPLTAPDSIFLCFNSTSVSLSASTFQVVSLKQGGGIFSYNEVTLVQPTGKPWTQSSFFSPSSLGPPLSAAEFGTVRDVLGTDPAYATGYLLQRYDTLKRDSQGASITGLLNFTSDLDATQRPASQAASGNCVLLTGAWQAKTRYELTIQFNNPGPPASGAETAPLPLPWIAPVTVTTHTSTVGSGAYQTADVAFTVRGSKAGTLCTIRSAAASALGTMFDACAAAHRLGLISTPPPPDAAASQNSTDSTAAALTPVACLKLLQGVGKNGTSAAANASRAGLSPYSHPPLLPVNLTTFAQPSCGGVSTAAASAVAAIINTSASRALSARYGGDCISCGLGVPIGGTNSTPATNCSCPANVATQLVGPTACGPYLSPTGSSAAVTAGTTAQALCDTYTAAQRQWQQRLLSSKNVVRLYLRSFTAAAAGLMDEVDIGAAAADFQEQYIQDPRYPDSPTRRTSGVKPSCAHCKGTTTFIDVFTEKELPVYDNHFEAMNVFRLIGYLLDTLASQPCKALWDRQEPLKMDYGPYEKVMCQKLAPPPNITAASS